MNAELLVLFDVDGTLIQTGRAGVRGLNAALRRLHGAEDGLDGVPIAGRTDRAIVSDALRRIGVAATSDEIARLRDVYIEELRIEIKRPVDLPSGVLSGVGPLLDALSAANVFVGLLTGNFEQGAAIKLGHFDLWRRFAFGAFGDDHLHRRDLMSVAVERALRHGHRVPAADRIVVIGDTPLDIDCAAAYGARSIGVATGPFDTAALAEARADLVVETLAEVEHLMDWIRRT